MLDNPNKDVDWLIVTVLEATAILESKIDDIPTGHEDDQRVDALTLPSEHMAPLCRFYLELEKPSKLWKHCDRWLGGQEVGYFEFPQVNALRWAQRQLTGTLKTHLQKDFASQKFKLLRLLLTTTIWGSLSQVLVMVVVVAVEAGGMERKPCLLLVLLLSLAFRPC